MVAISPNRRIRQPLLLKVLFVLLLTGILILSAVAGYLVFFRRTEPPPHFLRRGLQKCTASLAAEIGYPPNFEYARALATELGIGIRIELPDGKAWQSSDDLLSKPFLDAYINETPVKSAQKKQEHKAVSKINRQGADYSFYFQTQSEAKGLLREIFWLIAALTLILIVSFFVIRWLFRPLRWLMDGVDAISEGNLDYQVSVRPGDEFASLGIAFNQMTRKINEMIKAREQLLSDLSHELRSPLARLQVSTEFIDKPELKDNLKSDLREMDSMVSEVLEGARLTSLHGGIKKTQVNIDQLLETLTAKYEMSAPGVKLMLPKRAHISLILGDEERLKSALRNLIENALKYSSQQSRPVEIIVDHMLDSVEIKVRDYGIGIPKDDLSMVFEPFYRVDKSRTRTTGGYGLGLNLCRKIIEAHGGTIFVESTIGVGTTFTVRLKTI